MFHPAVVRRWFSASLVVAALLCATTAVRADDFAEAWALFTAATYSDNADASAQATIAWQRLHAAQPDHPLFLAYLGASEALAGRYAWMPWTKLQRVDTGLAHLDKALALPVAAQSTTRGAPVAEEVRLVAANTYLDLPSMFNTRERGLALTRALSDGLDRSDWPAGFRAAVCLLAARAANSVNDMAAARRWLARARPLVGDDNRLALAALERELQ